MPTGQNAFWRKVVYLAANSSSVELIQYIRTQSDDPDFLKLVQSLDADLRERDGDDHAFYAQFNTLVSIKHVVLAKWNGEVVGCGAFKPFGHDAVEIKRMYVMPEQRGKGIAGGILRELERWAVQLGYRAASLETGQKQPEAIRLYEKSGYARIPNFGPYEGIKESLCFSKLLSE